MWRLFRKFQFLRNKDGATAIEYALLAGGLSLAIAAAVLLLGDDMVELYTTIKNKVSEALAQRS